MIQNQDNLGINMIEVCYLNLNLLFVNLNLFGIKLFIHLIQDFGNLNG